MADRITHVAILDRGGPGGETDRYGFATAKVWRLPAPYRHHHVRDAMVMRNIPIPINEGSERYDYGFTVGADGAFLTREEAELVARACGQLTKPNIGGPMTSEDLW